MSTKATLEEENKKLKEQVSNLIKANKQLRKNVASANTINSTSTIGRIVYEEKVSEVDSLQNKIDELKETIKDLRTTNFNKNHEFKEYIASPWWTKMSITREYLRRFL